MVKGYDKVQTLAFPLDPDSLPPHTFQALPLPEAWRRAIDAAVNLPAGRRHVTVRHHSLHATLRATFPALIAINERAWSRPEEYWLLADAQVAPEQLVALLRSWLQVEYGQKMGDVAALQAQLQPEALQWRSVAVQLGAGGPSGMDYSLAPHLAAHALCQAGVAANLPTERLEWYRVVDPAQGAEVISWPPLQHQAGGGRVWYYSYLLTFTLQTLPFSQQAVLHLDVGIRRWASRVDKEGRVRLPRGQHTTVYFQVPDTSWLSGEGRPSFCSAPAGRQYVVGGGTIMPFVWKDQITAVLQHAHHQPLLDVETIAHGPEAFLQPGSPIKAGIVFGNWKGETHGIGTGTTAADRACVLQHVREALPWLRPAEPLAKAEPRRLRQRKAEAEERARALHDAVGPDARMEIWWQNPAVIDRFKSALKELLGASEVTPDRFRTPYGQIVLRDHRFPDSLTGKLNLSDGSRVWSVVQPAAQQRASDVADYVVDHASPTSGTAPVLAFVQIEDQRWDPADAKPAIRSGFARTGRLTQCFLGQDKEAQVEGLLAKGLPEKATEAKAKRERGIQVKYQNTVLDLLRQTGQLPAPLAEQLNPVAPGVSADTTLLGFWLIKQNRTSHSGPLYLPVAVRTRLDRTAVEAAIYGGTGWQPLPQALLALPNWAAQPADPKRAVDWLQELVQGAVAAGPTLLMVDAHNARTTWRWLGNQRLQPERLHWDSWCEGQAIGPQHYPGLRVVRLRSHQQHETPQWYGFGGGERVGITTGLFAVSDRLIHSIAPKADTMQGPVSTTKPERPGSNAGMPEVLELAFPFLQPSDDVWDWAWLAHHLRSVHSHFGDSTVLPLPLHLAAKMEEYVVGVGE